jgi:hypothetical protein
MSAKEDVRVLLVGASHVSCLWEQLPTMATPGSSPIAGSGPTRWPPPPQAGVFRLKNLISQPPSVIVGCCSWFTDGVDEDFVLQSVGAFEEPLEDCNPTLQRAVLTTVLLCCRLAMAPHSQLLQRSRAYHY